MRSFLLGLWRLADPKISLASFSGMFLGACIAARDGALAVDWLVLTVIGIFCIEVAKNASGEIFDFDSGTDLAVAAEDRSPFSGGKRVLVDNLLTRHQTIAIAAVSYLLGIGAGLVIFGYREPLVFWLGVGGVGCAFFYQAPPFRLSYRGLGELAVALCYGPLITAGTYLVQRGTVTPEVGLRSGVLGLLIAAFLLINEFPDYRADLASGRLNLVVRLGPRKAARVFVAILCFSGAALAIAPFAGVPIGVWLGALFLIPASFAARTLLRHPEVTPRVIPAQALTLLAFVLYALGSGIGLILWE
ncbi:MAG: prenyltransferase [Deltaproteobacteria bacterium]|nr:prenyltransferase [Deltaproteobacteria bacterium]